MRHHRADQYLTLDKSTMHGPRIIEPKTRPTLHGYIMFSLLLPHFLSTRTFARRYINMAVARILYGYLRVPPSPITPSWFNVCTPSSIEHCYEFRVQDRLIRVAFFGLFLTLLSTNVVERSRGCKRHTSPKPSKLW